MRLTRDWFDTSSPEDHNDKDQDRDDK